MKKMQRKLRDEEMRILRGEAEVDENGLDDSDSDESDDGGGAMAQRQGQKRATPPDVYSPRIRTCPACRRSIVYETIAEIQRMLLYRLNLRPI